jgi:hypothetical protein
MSLNDALKVESILSKARNGNRVGQGSFFCAGSPNCSVGFGIHAMGFSQSQFEAIGFDILMIEWQKWAKIFHLDTIYGVKITDMIVDCCRANDAGNYDKAAQILVNEIKEYGS